jgi:hypothetical protein
MYDAGSPVRQLSLKTSRGLRFVFGCFCFIFVIVKLSITSLPDTLPFVGPHWGARSVKSGNGLRIRLRRTMIRMVNGSIREMGRLGSLEVIDQHGLRVVSIYMCPPHVLPTSVQSRGARRIGIRNCGCRRVCLVGHPHTGTRRKPRQKKVMDDEFFGGCKPPCEGYACKLGTPRMRIICF